MNLTPLRPLARPQRSLRSQKRSLSAGYRQAVRRQHAAFKL